LHFIVATTTLLSWVLQAIDEIGSLCEGDQIALTLQLDIPRSQVATSTTGATTAAPKTLASNLDNFVGSLQSSLADTYSTVCVGPVSGWHAGLNCALVNQASVFASARAVSKGCR
jgi:hypothetical protein